MIAAGRTCSCISFRRFSTGVHPELHFFSIGICELPSIFKALLKGTVIFKLEAKFLDVIGEKV
jgi:hypothetical protein